jgi:hypothetical protein
MKYLYGCSTKKNLAKNKCLVCKRKNVFGIIYKGHVCHRDCYDMLMLVRSIKKDLDKLATLIYKIAKKGGR